MATPVITAGASTLGAASQTASAGSLPATGLARAGAGIYLRGRAEHDSPVGWLLGGLALVLALVVMLPVLVIAVIIPAAEGSAAVEQIGPGSPIPAGYIPVFNAAAAAVDVNPYLLASVAEQESGFSAEGVNSSGCAGFMQIGIGIGSDCGDTWDSTVTLTSDPSVTIIVHSAFQLGARPSSYTGQTPSHPNYNDPFDAVMAAAVWLRHQVGGHPIPLLDNTAYEAACGYYGACSSAGVPYAQDVLDRALQWQSESALGASTLTLTSAAQASILPNGDAAAPADAPAMVQRAIAAANRIHTAYYLAQRPEPLNTVYPWYDCSAATDYVLYNAGLSGPGVTVEGPFAGDSTMLESYGAPGPGTWITIYANPTHAFIVIAGLAFDTADFGGPNIPAGSGPRWRQDPTGNLADGATYVVRHPPGL